MVSRGHSGSVVLALSVGTCFLLSAVLSPQGKVLARGEGVGVGLLAWGLAEFSEVTPRGGWGWRDE